MSASGGNDTRSSRYPADNEKETRPRYKYILPYIVDLSADRFCGYTV